MIILALSSWGVKPLAMDSAVVFSWGDEHIPEWAKHHHDWEAAADVTKLKTLEVRMKLCCNSCIEKIGEWIRSMPGVFDFRTNKTENLLTIYETPDGGPNHKQLLKKLKKIDKRAKILETKSSSEEETTAEEKNNTIYYVMTPWCNPQGYSVGPSSPTSTTSSTQCTAAIPLAMLMSCAAIVDDQVKWVRSTSRPPILS